MSNIDFEDFARLVGSALDAPADTLEPSHRLGFDVPLDELSLASLVMALQERNPWFEIPDQLDLADVTLADLHHFHVVMGPGHAGAGAADSQGGGRGAR